MSSWTVEKSGDTTLRSAEGELVAVRISVEPKWLEELLETLAEVSFPINPQIYHHAGPENAFRDQHVSVVEFPAYSGRLDEVRRVLARAGLHRATMRVTSMLEEIRHKHAVAG